VYTLLRHECHPDSKLGTRVSLIVRCTVAADALAKASCDIRNEGTNQQVSLRTRRTMIWVATDTNLLHKNVLHVVYFDIIRNDQCMR
jgi:hypothetical protein